MKSTTPPPLLPSLPKDFSHQCKKNPTTIPHKPHLLAIYLVVKKFLLLYIFYYCCKYCYHFIYFHTCPFSIYLSIPAICVLLFFYENNGNKNIFYSILFYSILFYSVILYAATVPSWPNHKFTGGKSVDFHPRTLNIRAVFIHFASDWNDWLTDWLIDWLVYLSVKHHAFMGLLDTNHIHQIIISQLHRWCKPRDIIQNTS